MILPEALYHGRLIFVTRMAKSKAYHECALLDVDDARLAGVATSPDAFLHELSQPRRDTMMSTMR